MPVQVTSPTVLCPQNQKRQCSACMFSKCSEQDLFLFLFLWTVIVTSEAQPNNYKVLSSTTEKKRRERETCDTVMGVAMKAIELHRK